MSKREIYEQKTEEILLPVVEEYGFELVDVEYVKEGGTWYLRSYIDKPGGISIDDCEKVSRRLSDKDFRRSLGREVEVRTYRMIDKSKEFTGILETYDEEGVTIILADGAKKTFEKGDIALVRLAFDF